MKIFGELLIGQLVKKVILASVNEADGHLTDDDEGSHDPQGGRIFISEKWCGAGADCTRVRETILHEVVHAWFEAAGVRVKLRALSGVSNAKWEEIEEDIVNMLTPTISSSLPSLMKLIALSNVRRVLGGA